MPFLLAQLICTIVSDSALLRERLIELASILVHRRYPIEVVKAGITKALQIPQEQSLKVYLSYYSWREQPRDTRRLLLSLRNDVTSFKMPNNQHFQTECANLLLIGNVGAGKSSIVNTIQASIQGRYSQEAQAGEKLEREQSFTMKYMQYQFSAEDGNELKFRIGDTCGMERRLGLHGDDFDFLVGGHIAEGYTFDENQPIQRNNRFFIPNPDHSDKINCVVFVIDASELATLPREMEQKIRAYIGRLNRRDVNTAILLTQVDRLCPYVKQNVSNVYHSTKVKEAVELAAKIFGLPEMNIMPMKSYHQSTTPHRSTNILALKNLKYLLDLAHAHARLMDRLVQTP